MLLAGCFQEDKTLIFVAFEADSQLAQIEKKAFLNACLRSICLPASVQGLGMQCFYNCLSLVSVVFEPSSQLKQVGPWAFSNTALIRICFPSDVPPGRIKLQPPLFSESRVAEILFGAVPANPCSGLCAGTALRRVMVPFEQKELPVACFSGCGRLKKVIFAVGCQLQELRKDTFAWTSLRSITIPASVKVIKAQCFLGCEDLVSVDFESGSQIRLIERDAFLGSPQVQSTLPDGTQHSSEELNLKGWKR
jgi:hypothetical protein